VALQPPETPEGPGWCGQGAARDQHGPDLSGVASQRPNRLRGLSVEGRCLSRDHRKRRGRTAQTSKRQCQARGERTRKEGGSRSPTVRRIATSVPSKVPARRENGPRGLTERDVALRMVTRSRRHQRSYGHDGNCLGYIMPQGSMPRPGCRKRTTRFAGK
jgi:hypothetical protein